MLSFSICASLRNTQALAIGLQRVYSNILPVWKKKSFERKFAEINISTAHSSKNHRDIKLHFWSFAFNETIYIPYFILFPSSCRCWKKFTAMSKEYLLSVHCCSCHQHSHHTDSRLPGGTRRTVKWHDMYEGDACKQT